MYLSTEAAVKVTSWLRAYLKGEGLLRSLFLGIVNMLDFGNAVNPK